jgi:hypothetical protein
LIGEGYSASISGSVEIGEGGLSDGKCRGDVPGGDNHVQTSGTCKGGDWEDGDSGVSGLDMPIISVDEIKCSRPSGIVRCAWLLITSRICVGYVLYITGN